MNILREADDHGHSESEHGHDEATKTLTETVEHSEHEHSGIDGLLEVMFGWEHVLAEVFWNTVWLGFAFAIGRLVAFRRVHRYIDDKHGVSHDKKEY